MKIVIAMDSFKGSLSAVEACRAAADGIASLITEAKLILKPMADGGEGTSSAMIAAGSGQWIEKTVTGPLPGMAVKAGFAWFAGKKIALVEMASASGLTLLSPQQKKPLKTTTCGTGELIAAAIDHGSQKILLAVGGSATTDGGTGAAAALGWKFLDGEGKEIIPCGSELIRISQVVPPPANADIPKIEVLCDVDNPLCGPHGAANVYGPQKGATPDMVEQLDAGLAHLAKVIKEQLGKDIADIRGAGAAGGLAAGAIAFMNAKLISGIETVMAHSQLAEGIASADYVVTGEGRFDSQSLRGKVVSGVVQKAKTASVPVFVLAGEVALKRNEYRKFGIVDAVGCKNRKMSTEYAMASAKKLLTEAAKKLTIKHFMQLEQE